VTPDRDADVERICQEALERPLAARASFLTAACEGDTELRRQVEMLLAQEGAAASFLETPALVIAAQHLAASGDALLPGQRIGPYTIVSGLGAGGMGEVYRARDESLGRDVAIKVLPSLFTRDPDRLARFEREARVLASLNHPNIATIHGVERSDEIRALVMEVVEGETLAERIDKGPVPVEESLAIALQVADALEAAHDKGIIHRDLKPANIKLTPEGRVKVLDFGLAKVVDRATGEPTAAATETIAATRPGLVVGTAAYMSPEQARGELLDRRTDIWAFGCLLFEMLTGRSPFLGNTVAESLVRVLEGEPDFDALPPHTPPFVHRLLRLCLQRSRRARLQHIGDARVEIEDARAHPSVSQERTAPAGLRRWGRMSAAAAAVAIAAAGGGWLVAIRFAPANRVPQYLIEIAPSANASPISSRSFAISPDGSRLVLSTPDGLKVRAFDASGETRIPVIGNMPFFKPDGEWVAFFSSAGLQKIRVNGGEAETVTAATVGRPFGGSWGEDGTVVFADGLGLFQVPEAGGTPRELARPTAARGELRHAWPQILPGGSTVLFTILHDRIADAEIAVIDLNTRRQQILMRGGHGARYVPSGHVVYASAGKLHAMRLDVASLTISNPIAIESGGQPMAIAETNGGYTANFDVSRTGTLAYVAPMAGARPLRTLVWVGRDGREEIVRGARPDRYVYVQISPDGSCAAVDVGGANRDIWTYCFERQTMTKISYGPTEDLMPAWSADSRRVFFASDAATGRFQIYSRAADGSGMSELVFGGLDDYMPVLSPDSSRLFVVRNGATAPDLMELALVEPRTLTPLVATEHLEFSPNLSPDRRWLAYHSTKSGRSEVYIEPYPNRDGSHTIVSSGGGAQAIWGPAGSGELYYRDANGTMKAVTVRPGQELGLGATIDLFPDQNYAQGTGAPTYAVSPTDGRFLMMKEGAGRAAPITVKVHWSEDLKRLLPQPSWFW
jgi:serine/threonine-protein kinase